MMAVLFSEFIITIIFLASLIILNFVLFKIPVKQNDKQIALLALVVGTVNFFFKYELHSPYVILLQTLVYVIILMIVRRYPILYSMIVCLTGLILTSVLDAIVTLGALQLKLTTMEKMQGDFSQFIIFHLIMTASYLLTAYILSQRKIGFSFIVRRFLGVSSISTYNFIWAITLLLGAVILQLTSMKIDDYSYHIGIIVIMTVSLIIAILYAINKNKIMLKDRRIDK